LLYAFFEFAQCTNKDLVQRKFPVSLFDLHAYFIRQHCFAEIF